VIEFLETKADPVTALRDWWERQPDSPTTEQPAGAAAALRRLEQNGLLDLPKPGRGRTRDRFELLATLGELDLTVGRLGEAHVDAIAILSELGAEPSRPGQLWGVWAAEPPNARVSAAPDSEGSWRLTGRKAWCSGAGIATNALVTAHAPDGARLFAVDLAAPQVRPVDELWQGLALTGCDTRSVDFAGAAALAVGDVGDYVQRPGFWHGAAGVAAVWYGGAVAVARALVAAADGRELDQVSLAHLGAIDVALGAAQASLASTAAAIDADPNDHTQRAAAIARQTRGVVEATATEVIDRVGRALGATPLAMDRVHARRVADLALYVRQSHGDRDLADLGRRLLEVGDRW
jgi:alkylation response protein AidB-like acyl-CoA dehydrogenase